MHDPVRAGKVLYAGMSDIPAWQVSRVQAIAELYGWAPLIRLEIPCNLIERTVERNLIPMAQITGLGVICWSPLGGSARRQPRGPRRPARSRATGRAGRGERDRAGFPRGALRRLDLTR